MNVQQITVSAKTNAILLVDENNNEIGQITTDGVTSKSQQQLVECLASYNESHANFLRTAYSSGFVAARSYNVSRPFDNRYKMNGGGMAALNMHSHPEWNGVCGLAEFSSMVNGYSVTTRHNDYRIMVPYPTGTFGDRLAVTAPPVPASVLALPTGFTGTQLNSNLAGTQAEWMQNVYDNNPEQCVVYLSYMEVWIEAYDGSLLDIASSPSVASAQFGQTFQNMLSEYTQYLRSGFKTAPENLALLSGVVIGSDPVTGQPTLGYINWRISSIPVGTLSTNDTTLNVPLATVDLVTGQTNDITPWQWSLTAMPYDYNKAAAGVVDSTNVWTLRRQIHQLWWANSRGRSGSMLQGGGTFSQDVLNNERQWSDVALSDPSAMFDNSKLEMACRACPGFDGLGNSALQTQNDPNGTVLDGVSFLASAGNNNGLSYYSNGYALNTVDASGYQNSNRGFNDTNLFTAATSFPNVLGGFSFMIPLEMVVRTPRDSWNPLGVAFQPAVTGDGGSPTNGGVAYTGYNDYGIYYMMPDSVIPEQNQPIKVQGDTTDTAFVVTPSGTAVMKASGVRLFEPDGYRRRFCVVPDALQFSSVGRDLAWLKFQLKPLLKEIASTTATGDMIDGAF
jgi:hypothetical protein